MKKFFAKLVMRSVVMGGVLVGSFLTGMVYERHGESAKWLALNLYHENRFDSELGRRAIAAVVFNRMNDSRWPDTVMEVVTDGTERGPRCDFSWYCDGKKDFNTKFFPWLQNYVLAYRVLIERDAGRFTDPTHGATWYHVRTMKKPGSWPDALVRVGDVGNHTFYRYPHSITATAVSP
jgi:spore germination cell wall hydrolase CwlJ-like protein